MALHTLYGSGTPTLTIPGDTAAVNLATAFYIQTATGWTAERIRFYVAAGTTGLPASGHLGYLFGSSGSPPAPSGTALATCTFTGVAVDQWNEAVLDTPVTLTPGSIYWATVYFPSGRYSLSDNAFFSGDVVALDGSALKARQSSLVSPGNGAFRYGTAGSLPTEGSGSDWYGVDVVTDDHVTSGSSSDVADAVGLTDAISWTRTGLPTTMTATGTAADPLGLTATDPATIGLGGDTGIRTVAASLLGNRITWGSAIDSTIQGPSFTTEAAGAIALGLQFKLQRACRVTISRIYKAPDAAGTITVGLWSTAGVLLASTTLTWVADAGGWRNVDLPTVDAASGDELVASYHVPNGTYSVSQWVWNAQATVAHPFEIADFESGANNGLYRVNAAPGFPTSRTAHNYYIDLEATWDDSMPGYGGGGSYYAQWTHGQPAVAFPVAVFNTDPEFMQGYADVGINTIVASPASAAHIDAIKSAGLEIYADAQDHDLSAALAAAEDSAWAALLKGYFMVDEPDLISPYHSPQVIREWINAVRAVDSTRPCILNMGKVPPYAQGFFYQPTGSTIQQAAQLWRDWAALADVLSCDFYNMTSSTNEGGRFGIWTYPSITRKMVDLSDGRVPVWGYVESTSQDPGEPTPEQVRRASWAHLIAGARGIVFFDHRFVDADVTQNFAAMLSDTAMSAMVTALSSRLQSLATALFGADLGLVTAVSGTGVLAAAKGGIAAGAEIPMHYTTRASGGTRYLFAMPIRPGSTTATFTIPSAASKTLTVIDESRTVTTDGSGVFSDAFSSDYAVHLYSWAA